jgi:flavin reductase (DIM6/NTAB) family NADH-FMN oxidoreductase RutF
VPNDEVAQAFHAISADLDYPMVIVTTAVTTAEGTERAGCLVGFMSQCSIKPPLLMVWMSKRNRTTRAAEGASSLLVHFPSNDERALTMLFGSETGDEVDKFARCRWEPGPEGLPLLADCTRWVAGHIVERLDAGDHVGHLLDLFEAAAGAWSGQIGFQSVKDLDPGHEP